VVFIPPFHDHSRALTFDAIVARLRSVVGEAGHGGHVEVPVVSAGSQVLVWSRDERPVAFVFLGYDWIRLEFASSYSDVRGLADEPMDDVLDRVEAAIRERLTAVEALGPRTPGDVSGDEPSSRTDYDAALAGVEPEQWSGELLNRLLADRGFGPGAIDLPIILPAVRAWLGQAAPHTQVTMDEFTVELYDWPGDDSTLCAPPPESLSEEAPWVGVGFGRSPKREIDEGLVSVNGGVLQLWYPTDDDWRSLFLDLDLQPDSVVSFEAFGHGGSCSQWLLSDPLVERIFKTAATKHAALAYRWTGDDVEEISGR
jgi:hypothetical protein